MSLATATLGGRAGPLLPPAAMAATAWSGAIAACQLCAPGWPVAAGAAVLALLAVAVAAVVRPALPAILVAAALAGAVRVAAFPADPGELARARALAGTTVTFTGTVADAPRAWEGGAEILVAPLAGGYGNVVVRVRGPVRSAAGDVVSVRGTAHLPANTEGFDRREYLAQRGAHLELSATAFRVQAPAGGPAAFPGWLRERYRTALDSLLQPPHAAVLAGIVLGERDGIPAELNRQLVATGLVHLLVLSGLKVAVFARLASAALSPWLGHRAPIPIAGLVGLYALVGGATPAAVRAAAMGGVALLAQALGRPSHVWTSLAATAAVMLGWQPELARDAGFQLSFVGTAAIVLLTPPIEHRFGFLPRVVREPFAVTCAAQVGTLPVMAQSFHVLSPVAPLANAAVLPLLPLMVAAGMLVAPAAAAPEIGRVLALPLAVALTYLEEVARVLSRAPAAALPVAAFPPWATAVYYGSGGLALAALRSAGRRRLAAAAAAVTVLVAGLGWQLASALKPSPAAAFLGVGEGQAVLLTGPRGVILVDGGASPAGLATALASQLPPWARTVDALIVTGPGRAEAAGLAGLPLSAGSVIVPQAPMEGAAWRSVVEEQRGRGAAVRPVLAGDRLELAGLRIDVLAPEPRLRAADAGAAALALRARYPDGRSVCIFGPLDLPAQEQAAVRLPGRCTYLVVAGGGRGGPAPALLAAARPEHLVLSTSGSRLPRGLPEEIVRRTDREGTIVVRP